jgi:hypothetical protein
MATKSKKALPEITVTADQNPALIAKAKEALRLRAQIADLEVQEKALKQEIAEEANRLRKIEESSNKNYIGLVKMVDGDQAASQVQFKIMAGLVALGMDQEATLDALYGTGRTHLFGKHVEVTVLRDPLALIKELQDQGKNPLDLLDIKIKPGLDRAFIGSPNVTFEEFFLPVEGFLATSNELSSTWGDETKKYHGAYLDKVLKPAVSLGHK